MLAAITDGTPIKRLLTHLGLPTEPLPVALAREPPQSDLAWKRVGAALRGPRLRQRVH